jgi:hypothetical protein
VNRREFNRLLGRATGAFTLAPFAMADLPFIDGITPDSLADDGVFARLRGEPPAHAEIRVERGGARLFLNDKEVLPFWGSSLHLMQTAGNYRDAGITLLHPVLGLESAWRGASTYDWTEIDGFLARLLTLVPDARFLPRLHLDTPEWWKDAHPEELTVYGLPTKESEYNIARKRPIPVLEGGHVLRIGAEVREASFASTVWREDTAAMLKAFIDHVEASPLRSRMIGYHPTTGRTAEWNYFGEMYMPDYSAPMKRMVGTIPDVLARRTTTYGLLRDPEKEGDVMRFYTAYHEVIADTVVYICRAIKEAAHNRVLCGVFYGYITEQPRLHEGGYLAARTVLDSPHIDYIASPYSYQPGNTTDARGVRVTMTDGAGNTLGHARGVAGDGAYRMPMGSLRRRGKLFIAELDPSTYRDTVAHDVIGGHGGLGSGTVEGSLRILRRDIGGVLANGVGGWLLDFGPLNHAPEGWYSGEPVIREIRELIQLAAHRPAMDISSEGDMCVLFDQQSFTATEHWLAGQPWENYGIKSTDYINHWFVNTQMRSLRRMGAPLDSLFTFDLAHGDVRRYRMFFAVNAFLMSDEESSAMQTKLRGSGATVVWYYAPAFISPRRLDLKRMEQLTGFRFSVNVDPGTMLIRTTMPGAGDVVEAGFGVKEDHFPRFVVRDRDVEVLGEWQDGIGPAFARKEYNGYTSIYVGSAPVPVKILCALAKQAGVPLWSTRHDIVAATHDAAMLVATDPGQRTLTLPRPMRRTSGGAASRTHDLTLETGQVELFLAG